MRVLVVAYYFPPTGGGGVNRTLKLVRGLAAADWRPIVLTVDRAAWVQDPSLLGQVPRRTAVLRLPNPDWGRVTDRWPVRAGERGSTRNSGRLRRWLVPDLHVGWSALAAPVVALMAATRAVDLVYTTCPPYSANLAGLAARACGVPWVADFRDAWTDCPSRADLSAWRRRLERRIEVSVLRRADQVLFASDGARERAVRRIPGLRARSRTVLTGFDAADFASADRSAPLAGRLELVHAGSVLVMNRLATLDHLLAALRTWSARDPRVPATVRLRFLGAEPAVADRLESAGVGGWVRAEPAVPRAALGAELRRAHACLALASASPTGADPIPGKLFDAVGAGRPLLVLTPEGPLARLVHGRALGAVVAPEDREGIVAALSALRERAVRGERIPEPSEDVRRALCSERAVAQMLGALELACQRNRGGKPRECRSLSVW